MKKKMRMFIICTVFALIISCKNHADLKQGVEKKVKQGIENGIEIERKIKQGIEEQVKGFLEKEKEIISDDEIAKKLREEELKEKKENKQEEKKEEVKVEREEKQEELMQGDDPNSHISEPALKTTRDSVGQQKEEQRQKEKEEQKVVEQKEEQAKAKAEQERKEKEEKRKQEQQEQEEKQVKSKIETLTKKIDEINRDIDSIKYKSWFVGDEKRITVGPQEVIDKVTGPILDYFTI
ncbi:hypothetical protein [Borreliella valaisiana]|uniref:hypothetical protein n=1 Tax=Borreliella valaisiana TaxID=62088 RepID=UPI003B226151